MIDFANKAGILGQFWIEFRDDEDMKNFTEFNDVGLPLGYFIAEGLVKETPMAETFVQETFDLLLAALEVTEDELVDVTNLNELMAYVDDKKATE
jgi:hypothetical protein